MEHNVHKQGQDNNVFAPPVKEEMQLAGNEKSENLVQKEFTVKQKAPGHPKIHQRRPLVEIRSCLRTWRPCMIDSNGKTTSSGSTDDDDNVILDYIQKAVALQLIEDKELCKDEAVIEGIEN